MPTQSVPPNATICPTCLTPFKVRGHLSQKYCSRKCLLEYRSAPPSERFWRFVDKTNTCWLWTGGQGRHGYGMFRFNGKHTSAHRVSWELHNGPIPEGKCVLHNCPGGDNGSCVNPAHLWIGTNAENSQDMVDKGRSAKLHGERHHLHKLTWADVRKIRELRAQGYTFSKLSRLFGTSPGRLCLIVQLKAWPPQYDPSTQAH
jgi:HNH endonuclease